jgi:hypothetical protein
VLEVESACSSEMSETLPAATRCNIQRTELTSVAQLSHPSLVHIFSLVYFVSKNLKFTFLCHSNGQDFSSVLVKVTDCTFLSKFITSE